MACFRARVGLGLGLLKKRKTLARVDWKILAIKPGKQIQYG